MAPGSEPASTVVPSALPSTKARLLAVVAVIVAGVCGALIGQAFVELQCTGDCTALRGIGLVVGAAMASLGVAVVAVLTLRAMDEWQDTARRKRSDLDIDTNTRP